MSITININCQTVVVSEGQAVSANAVGDLHSLTVGAPAATSMANGQPAGNPPSPMFQAPKYHGNHIAQYGDEVFIWYDESGLFGGFAYSLEEAEVALEAYAKATNAIPDPTPPTSPDITYPIRHHHSHGHIMQYGPFVFVWYNDDGFIGGASDSELGAIYQLQTAQTEKWAKYKAMYAADPSLAEVPCKPDDEPLLPVVAHAAELKHAATQAEYDSPVLPSDPIPVEADVHTPVDLPSELTYPNIEPDVQCVAAEESGAVKNPKQSIPGVPEEITDAYLWKMP